MAIRITEYWPAKTDPLDRMASEVMLRKHIRHVEELCEEFDVRLPATARLGEEIGTYEFCWDSRLFYPPALVISDNPEKTPHEIIVSREYQNVGQQSPTLPPLFARLADLY